MFTKITKAQFEKMEFLPRRKGKIKSLERVAIEELAVGSGLSIAKKDWTLLKDPKITVSRINRDFGGSKKFDVRVTKSGDFAVLRIK